MMKEIKLTQGKVALVDDDVFDEVNKYKWYAVKIGGIFYAQTRISMHYFVWKLLTGKEPEACNDIDHKENKDKDSGLNNLFLNLREVTRQQNCINRRKKSGFTSEYKGIYWNNNRKKWHSQICFNYKKIHLGFFDDEVEAAKVYDRAALYYFGLDESGFPYAFLNFPENKDRYLEEIILMEFK